MPRTSPKAAGPASTRPQHSEFPTLVYPLARDPRADSTEYIFEDADQILPIFNYEIGKIAAEVIILHKGRIVSVDYLPEGVGTYMIAGRWTEEAPGVEFPYLGRTEKLPFIDLVPPDVSVHILAGHETHIIGDSGSRKLGKSGNVLLKEDEILALTNRDIQIFVRRTEAPPKVAPAPYLRNDKSLKAMLLLMMLFGLSVTAIFHAVDIEKPQEKEDAPELIAEILLKKKNVPKPEPIKATTAIAKTEQAPKEIAQKAPIMPSKEHPKETQPKPRQGDPSAAEMAEVKKAEPNKGPKDVLMDRVRPTETKPSPPKTAGGGGRPSTAPPRPAPQTEGHVDTYKPSDYLQSTVSSLLSKGGSTKGASMANPTGGGRGSGSGPGSGIGSSMDMESGGPSATLKTAQVSTNIGSLSGSAQGKLDSSKGVEGIADKKSIYTAGLPYKTVVLGGMDPDVIRRILIENIPHFRYCYQKVLDRAEDAFDGVVRLEFIIGASGHVTKAAAQMHDSSMPGDVRNCVVNVLRGIKFPAPMGGGVVEVNQPFNFYPKVK